METSLNPVQLTRKLLSFNTINPPGEEKACAKYIGDLLSKGGFQVDFYHFSEKRTSLVARFPSNKGIPICLTGHIDTVPLGGADWRADPFAGELADGKIFGRGSSDMKSGVAAMVIAALKITRKSSLAAGLTLVITAGEETGCQGAYYLASQPDVLGKAGAVVVGEPTSNYPLIGHKGALWIRAQTTGVTAHGSMPDQGVNAIYKACNVLEKLQHYDFNVSPHPYLGAPTINVGTIAGGININSVPDLATIGIDIRTLPEMTNRLLYQDLESYLGEDVRLEKIIDVGAIASDPSDTWIKDVWNIAASFLNENPVQQGVAYFTDASALTPAFGNPPTIILGPGEPAMAHKTDEFCYASKIEEAVEIYTEILENWQVEAAAYNRG